MGLWEDLKAKHSYSSVCAPRLAIGIPTINRADLLQENLDDLSINFGGSLHKLILLDNGDQNLDPIVPENLRSCLTLFNEPENRGVAGSWNKIIREAYYSHSPADHLIMLNDDVVLGKTPEHVLKLIDANPNYSLMLGSFYWSVFLISKRCVEDVGPFDEKFFPAYFEDNDFARRHDLIYKDRLPNPWVQVGVELQPTICRNSCTIAKDPGMNSGFGLNARRYSQKWGGSLGHEKFTVAFNGDPEPND